MCVCGTIAPYTTTDGRILFMVCCFIDYPSSRHGHMQTSIWFIGKQPVHYSSRNVRNNNYFIIIIISYIAWNSFHVSFCKKKKKCIDQHASSSGWSLFSFRLCRRAKLTLIIPTISYYAKDRLRMLSSFGRFDSLILSSLLDNRDIQVAECGGGCGTQVPCPPPPSPCVACLRTSFPNNLIERGTDFFFLFMKRKITPMAKK